MKASILISSYNRLNLFRRTLFSISKYPPVCPYEVVVCDDNSSEDIHSLLKEFNSAFHWKLIRFDANHFEKITGLKKYLNNPCVTNNLAWKHSSGELLFTMGNEMLTCKDTFNELIKVAEFIGTDYFIIFSKTYEIPQNILRILDNYGSNLTQPMIDYCSTWALQKPHLMEGRVTNYLSLSSRALWDFVGGYNEMYYGGIACEDTDFYNTAAMLPGFQYKYTEALSLHQNHGGRNCFNPKGSFDDKFWDTGHNINLEIQKKYRGSKRNPQQWNPGDEMFIKEILTNG